MIKKREMERKGSRGEEREGKRKGWAGYKLN